MQIVYKRVREEEEDLIISGGLGGGLMKAETGGSRAKPEKLSGERKASKAPARLPTSSLSLLFNLFHFYFFNIFLFYASVKLSTSTLSFDLYFSF